MSRHLGSSPCTGEAARAPGRWTRPLFAGLIVVLVIASATLMLAVGAPAVHAPSAASSSAHPAAAPAANPPTHGDLVVASGETYTIQPTGGVPTYYQGGNITVESGGTLIVKNVSLIFVEYVSDTGTPIVRLSHIYQFQDAGTVDIVNSTVTTDVGVLNAYAKLNVEVTGTMSVQHSVLAFPGWVTASGTSADLTLNDSALTANPGVAGLGGSEPSAIWGDTSYAASLTATGGAHVYLFKSSINDTYADPTSTNGIPGTLPLNTTDVALGAAGENLTDLSTPTDSASLSQDYLYYPAGIAGGEFSIYYNNTNPAPTTTTLDIWYLGTEYSLGTVVLANDTSDGFLAIPIPAALTSAINAGGMLGYLNSTGDFGLPSGIAFNFSAVTTPLTLSEVSLVLNPPLAYNVNATGAGTVLVSADTQFNLNFADVPASPLSQVSPFPWESNKLVLTDGAVAYLGNLTVTASVPGVFSTSAVLTDATSTAWLYRWADFNVTSSTDHVNVSGALASAFYAYDDSQLNNATVNALNDLPATSAPLAGYVDYVDGLRGVAAYGSSDVGGQAYLLLVSNELNATDLPSGGFLGGYHVAFSSPFATNVTWISYSVSPYPTGVALGTANYGLPDRVNVAIPVAAPVVRFVTYNVPQSPLSLTTQYSSSGTIFLNGPGTASIVVTATPIGGIGTPITIASDSAVANGSFQFNWANPLPLTAGTSYSIVATATYKGAETSYTLGTYSVPSTTSPVGFLFQKFLGLPLWLWIAIAAAVVVAILVVLMIFRRQAAGKLVECGECGELIPEDATVCPKCGAEFESELVRCSRCSATIPANSQFCPECSAQLLGTPGEGASDPERQAYADFTEKYRTEAKRELGENYTESAFWDWWKRQPTYVPFSQWKAQQNKGVPRSGMSAPPAGSEAVAPAAPPPRGGAPPAGGVTAATAPTTTPAPPPTTGPAAAPSTSLKPCPNCGKEIPPEYLVCPFCGAVTQ